MEQQVLRHPLIKHHIKIQVPNTHYLINHEMKILLKLLNDIFYR